MTLPFERRYAIANTRAFLRAVAYDPKAMPRVPRTVRTHASRLLKHFPTEFDMENVKKAFGETNGEL